MASGERYLGNSAVLLFEVNHVSSPSHPCASQMALVPLSWRPSVIFNPGFQKR